MGRKDGELTSVSTERFGSELVSVVGVETKTGTRPVDSGLPLVRVYRYTSTVTHERPGRPEEDEDRKKSGSTEDDDKVFGRREGHGSVVRDGTSRRYTKECMLRRHI